MRRFGNVPALWCALLVCVLSGCLGDDDMPMDGGMDALDAMDGGGDEGAPRLLYANVEQKDDEGNAELVLVLDQDPKAPITATVKFPDRPRDNLEVEIPAPEYGSLIYQSERVDIAGGAHVAMIVNGEEIAVAENHAFFDDDIGLPDGVTLIDQHFVDGAHFTISAPAATVATCIGGGDCPVRTLQKVVVLSGRRVTVDVPLTRATYTYAADVPRTALGQSAEISVKTNPRYEVELKTLRARAKVSKATRINVTDTGFNAVLEIAQTDGPSFDPSSFGCDGCTMSVTIGDGEETQNVADIATLEERVFEGEPVEQAQTIRLFGIRDDILWACGDRGTETCNASSLSQDNPVFMGGSDGPVNVISARTNPGTGGEPVTSVSIRGPLASQIARVEVIAAGGGEQVLTPARAYLRANFACPVPWADDDLTIDDIVGITLRDGDGETAFAMETHGSLREGEVIQAVQATNRRRCGRPPCAYRRRLKARNNGLYPPSSSPPPSETHLAAAWVEEGAVWAVVQGDQAPEMAPTFAFVEMGGASAPRIGDVTHAWTRTIHSAPGEASGTVRVGETDIPFDRDVVTTTVGELTVRVDPRPFEDGSVYLAVVAEGPTEAMAAAGFTPGAEAVEVDGATLPMIAFDRMYSGAIPEDAFGAAASVTLTASLDGESLTVTQSFGESAGVCVDTSGEMLVVTQSAEDFDAYNIEAQSGDEIVYAGSHDVLIEKDLEKQRQEILKNLERGSAGEDAVDIAVGDDAVRVGQGEGYVAVNESTWARLDAAGLALSVLNREDMFRETARVWVGPERAPVDFVPNAIEESVFHTFETEVELVRAGLGGAQVVTTGIGCAPVARPAIAIPAFVKYVRQRSLRSSGGGDGEKLTSVVTGVEMFRRVSPPPPNGAVAAWVEDDALWVSMRTDGTPSVSETSAAVEVGEMRRTRDRVSFAVGQASAYEVVVPGGPEVELIGARGIASADELVFTAWSPVDAPAEVWVEGPTEAMTAAGLNGDATITVNGTSVAATKHHRMFRGELSGADWESLELNVNVEGEDPSVVTLSRSTDDIAIRVRARGDEIIGEAITFSDPSTLGELRLRGLNGEEPIVEGTERAARQSFFASIDETGDSVMVRVDGASAEIAADEGYVALSDDVFADYNPGELNVIINRDAADISDTLSVTVGDRPTMATVVATLRSFGLARGLATDIEFSGSSTSMEPIKAELKDGDKVNLVGFGAFSTGYRSYSGCCDRDPDGSIMDDMMGVLGGINSLSSPPPDEGVSAPTAVWLERMVDDVNVWTTIDGEEELPSVMVSVLTDDPFEYPLSAPNRTRSIFSAPWPEGTDRMGLSLALSGEGDDRPPPVIDIVLDDSKKLSLAGGIDVNIDARGSTIEIAVEGPTRAMELAGVVPGAAIAELDGEPMEVVTFQRDYMEHVPMLTDALMRCEGDCTEVPVTLEVTFEDGERTGGTTFQTVIPRDETRRDPAATIYYDESFAVLSVHDDTTDAIELEFTFFRGDEMTETVGGDHPTAEERLFTLAALEGVDATEGTPLRFSVVTQDDLPPYDPTRFSTATAVDVIAGAGWTRVGDFPDDAAERPYIRVDPRDGGPPEVRYSVFGRDSVLDVRTVAIRVIDSDDAPITELQEAPLTETTRHLLMPGSIEDGSDGAPFEGTDRIRAVFAGQAIDVRGVVPGSPPRIFALTAGFGKGTKKHTTTTSARPELQ